LQVEGGTQQQCDGRRPDPAGRHASGGAQFRPCDVTRDLLALERLVLRQAKHQVGDADRYQGRRPELRQPRQQLRHAAVEDHEVRRVGDRQHEARGVGDEGACEQIGQRRGAGRAGRRVYGGREHHGGGIVRQQHGHHRPDDVDESEQALRRAAGVFHRECREPIEQSLLPGELRQQHHTGQEEIDVEPLAYADQGIRPR
jgi:hypothetical protein